METLQIGGYITEEKNEELMRRFLDSAKKIKDDLLKERSNTGR